MKTETKNIFTLLGVILGMLAITASTVYTHRQIVKNSDKSLEMRKIEK